MARFVSLVRTVVVTQRRSPDPIMMRYLLALPGLRLAVPLTA
jgi:hypothetical protein